MFSPVGILPHSGKNIKFKELSAAIRHTYNFGSTFCFFVPNYAATMLNRSYWTDSFDLADLDVHNCIEHDGSLVRMYSLQSELCSLQADAVTPYRPGCSRGTRSVQDFSTARRTFAESRHRPQREAHCGGPVTPLGPAPLGVEEGEPDVQSGSDSPILCELQVRLLVDGPASQLLTPHS